MVWVIPKTLSAYVPDTEALNSVSNYLASECERCLLVRSKPMRLQTWLQRWNQGHWSRFLCGRTFEPSTHDLFLERWTASLEAIPVSHSPVPACEKVEKIHGTFGRIFSNTFVQLDLFGASSKMSQDTSILDLKRFSQALSVWATKLRQDCLQRQKSEHPINDSDCSSWLTPDVSDRRSAKSTQQGLSNQVNWLTPRCVEVEESYENYMKRMQASDNPKNNTKSNAGNLSMQVNWSTPTVMDTADIQSPRTPNPSGGQKPPLTQMVNWPTPEAFTERGPIPTEMTPQGFVSLHGDVRYGAKIADAVRAAEDWATPRVGGQESGATRVARGKDLGLQGQVEVEDVNWPSPALSDHKGAGQNDTTWHRLDYWTEKAELCIGGRLDLGTNNSSGKNHAPSCHSEIITCSKSILKSIRRALQKGRLKHWPMLKINMMLNPLWVCQLMGLPQGWTCFDFSATESFPNRCCERGECCGR